MVDSDPEPYLRLLRRHHPRIAKNRTSGFASSTSSTACSSPTGDGPPVNFSHARPDVNELVAQKLQAAKSIKAPQGLDLGDSFGGSKVLLSPTHLELPDAFQRCPHCTRNFAKEAAERHIRICGQLRSRPKPPIKEQPSCFTDSLGRRQKSSGCLINSPMNVSTPSRSLRTPARRVEAENGNSALEQQWMLVQLLLRDGLEALYDDNSISNTLRIAEECLTFLAKLEEWAKELHLRKGALSRMLLPFDSETSSGDQASTASLVPLGSKELDGLIPDEERQDLVAQAIKLRRLIRVKVADCADVEQARESLRLLTSFLRGLKQKASEDRRSLTSILREL